MCRNIYYSALRLHFKKIIIIIVFLVYYPSDLIKNIFYYNILSTINFTVTFPDFCFLSSYRHTIRKLNISQKIQNTTNTIILRKRERFIYKWIYEWNFFFFSKMSNRCRDSGPGLRYRVYLISTFLRITLSTLSLGQTFMSV